MSPEVGKQSFERPNTEVKQVELFEFIEGSDDQMGELSLVKEELPRRLVIPVTIVVKGIESHHLFFKVKKRR